MKVLKFVAPLIVAMGLTLVANSALAAKIDTKTKSCSTARGANTGATTSVTLFFNVRKSHRDIIKAEARNGASSDLRETRVTYKFNKYGTVTTRGNNLRVPNSKGIGDTQANRFGTFTATVQHIYRSGRRSTCVISF